MAIATAEPTFEQLASMVESLGPDEATPVTPEPKAPKTEAKEKPTEAAKGTAREAQQEDDEDEPLPEGVRKRIEKESARAAKIQAEIDKAVSTRKAKEQELASLNGKPGSEPAKTTEPKKDVEPVEPDLATWAGDLPSYNAAMKEYRAKYKEWLQADVRATVGKEFTERQANEAREKAWSEADERLSKAGTITAGEFPALMDSLAKALPKDLQFAISALDDWAAVGAHLAKNEDERTALVELFKANAWAAIASLGKLESRLVPEAKTAEATEEKETKPPKNIGGAARQVAKQKPLHEMIDKSGDAGDFLNEVGKMLKAS